MPLADVTLFGTLGTIGVLILLEGLLSADNALVIALLVKHLPPKDRRRALLVGLVGSFTFRLLAIVLATHLIKFWYLQAAGAVYLFYLPLKHMLQHGKKADDTKKDVPRKQPGFWATVAMVEFTDLVFAIDSILVAVSLSKVTWIIWLGGISGVVLLRFAAFLLVRVMDKLPGLEHMAYALVAWVAVKLSFMAVHSYSLAAGWKEPFHELSQWVFWTGMAIILVVGVFLSSRGAKRARPAAQALEVPEEAEDAVNDVTTTSVH